MDECKNCKKDLNKVNLTWRNVKTGEVLCDGCFHGVDAVTCTEVAYKMHYCGNDRHNSEDHILNEQTNDNITCPNCGNTDFDYSEWCDADEDECECDECGELFSVTAEHTVQFTTKRIKKESVEDVFITTALENNHWILDKFIKKKVIDYEQSNSETKL